MAEQLYKVDHIIDDAFDNGPFMDHCRQLRRRFALRPRVLLVQVPQIPLNTFDPVIARKRGYYNFPPTGLQYLHERVNDLGLEVRILNLNLEILKRTIDDETFHFSRWLDILTAELDAFRPSVVGVSCMFDVGIEPMLAILDHLRQRDDAVVVTGGLIATYEWPHLFEAGRCHFAVAGEGENKFRFLLASLFELPRAEAVATPGIHFQGTDAVCETRGPVDVVNFDLNLIASYDQVRIEEHCRYGSLNPFARIAGIEDTPFAPIQFHRGCRALCTFCSVHTFMGRGVRNRRVETVFEEMTFLVEQRGIRHFEWLDDDLLFRKEAFKDLLRRMIAKNWGITWSANNGLIAASIDDELMALVQDSGCIGLKIGFETGNPELLRQIKKPGGTLEKFRHCCAVVNRYPKVFTGANLIIGFPGERFEQIMDTFRFYLENRLDWGAFNACQAIRGASAFAEHGDYFESQMSGGGKNIKNFIPVRGDASGHLLSGEMVRTGLDVFDIDPKSEPGEEQVKEIWFTFNLVANFMFNRNLKVGARVEKFIAWVEMAQVPYPDNPYMCLFLALARRIAGRDGVERLLDTARRVLEGSGYWRQRFAEFDLDRGMADFPDDGRSAQALVEGLCRNAQKRFAHWFTLDHPAANDGEGR